MFLFVAVTVVSIKPQATTTQTTFKQKQEVAVGRQKRESERWSTSLALNWLSNTFVLWNIYHKVVNWISLWIQYRFLFVANDICTNAQEKGNLKTKPKKKTWKCCGLFMAKVLLFECRRSDFFSKGNPLFVKEKSTSLILEYFVWFLPKGLQFDFI